MRFSLDYNNFSSRHYFDDCLTEKEKLGLGKSEDPEKNFPFVKFCSQFFLRVPVLHPHLYSVEEILSKFKKWKGALPAYGVILLNPGLDKLLLVQEFGCKRRWGFPKGTLEAGESREECAAREAFEEVGVDVAHMIDNREWFERKIGAKVSIFNLPLTSALVQVRTLFIIPNSVAPHGISEATVFETKTKGEIGDIKWFSLKRSFSGNEFFTVKPFIGDIRRWVRRFGRYQAAHIEAWQTKHRTEAAVMKGGKREEEKTGLMTKLQWKDSGVVLAEEGEDAGVLAAKEKTDLGDGVLVAEEEFRLPSEFLPKAWASFHLDHQHLHQLAMGEVELAMKQHRIGVGEPVSEKPKARLMLRG